MRAGREGEREGGARMRWVPFSREMEGEAWAMRTEGISKGIVCVLIEQ